MKLLFVTDHTYPPHRVGGAESSTHDLALTLKEHGIEVAVLAAMPAECFRGLPGRAFRRVLGRRALLEDRCMGYPVFRSGDPVGAGDAVVSRFEPSAIVVTSGSYAPLSEPCVRRGLPTILYLRDVELAGMGGDLPRGVHVTYVSNSRFNASRFVDVAGVEPAVIPPLVRPERVRTETARGRVLFVNPVPQKGVDLAFRLAEERPDIPFDFVECWPLGARARERLLARARTIPNVAWHPVMSDRRRIYANARILLAPSMWEESWGRVVTEAHCSGIPVLASNRGGLPESVGPGGILVRHDAPLAHWCETLSRMWDDRSAYAALVAAAERHSMRAAIQPAMLVDKFVALVTAHIARCQRQRPPVGDEVLAG
jgi:glycosyltransferase involved in cell wall biosynthesis